jgi:hypothetical protein
MASLATARTRLGLAGVPKQPQGSFLGRVPPTDIPVSDTLSVSLTESTPTISAENSRTGYTQQFTRMALSGVQRLSDGSFVKQQITFVTLSVTDSWPVTLSEDPVDENQIVGGDEWRLTLTDIANLRNNQAVTDTLGVGISETISLLQAGVLTLSVTDTLSVSMTQGAGDVRVTLAVTDALDLTFTETDPSTIATPLELKTATDDLNVTLSGEESNLSIFAGVVPISATDLWSVALEAEVAGVAVQQPIGRITFRILTNSMKFEFV